MVCVYVLVYPSPVHKLGQYHLQQLSRFYHLATYMMEADMPWLRAALRLSVLLLTSVMGPPAGPMTDRPPGTWPQPSQTPRIPLCLGFSSRVTGTGCHPFDLQHPYGGWHTEIPAASLNMPPSLPSHLTGRHPRRLPDPSQAGGLPGRPRLPPGRDRTAGRVAHAAHGRGQGRPGGLPRLLAGGCSYCLVSPGYTSR